jgi:hypothetical protein
VGHCKTHLSLIGHRKTAYKELAQVLMVAGVSPRPHCDVFEVASIAHNHDT